MPVKETYPRDDTVMIKIRDKDGNVFEEFANMTMQVPKDYILISWRK